MNLKAQIPPLSARAADESTQHQRTAGPVYRCPVEDRPNIQIANGNQVQYMDIQQRPGPVYTVKGKKDLLIFYVCPLTKK